MLIEFRVANFRSIRDEQFLSMVANKGKEHPENTFAPGVKRFDRLLASAAIYGPNAAGKTNLLKALQFMQSVVVNSATQVGTSLAEYAPFKFDILTREAPSEFEVTFGDSDSGSTYQYKFSLDGKRIHKERLVQHKSSKASLLFDREYVAKKKAYDWEFGNSFRGNRVTWRENTRDEALFLSTAVQLNSTQLMPVFQWFQKRLVIIAGASTFNANLTLKLLKEPGGKERLLPFIREADFTITDVEAQDEPLRPDPLMFQGNPQFFLPLIQAGNSPSDPPTLAKVSFSHRQDDPVQIDLSDESNGTQALFRTAGAWLNVFARGEVLLVDEIDTSLHPLLVRFLIKRFHSSQTNPCKAQLVFATHSTTLLNQDLFRRDQIWFVERGKDYASRCYPLTDFSPRTDEVIEKWYMRGRYGALPILTSLDA